MLTRKLGRGLLGALAVLTLGAVGATRASAQVNVSGVVFMQYGYAFSDTAHFNSFDITRAYVNFRRKFNDGISTRVTTDLYRASNGSYNIRLKYAYLAWTPKNSPLTFRFGQSTTPWLDWQEGLWGYRLQGPMPLDRSGYVTSSDIGADMDGNFSKNLFDFQFSLVNGEGYHAGEGDQHKDVEARVSLRLVPSDDGGSRGGLRATVYGGIGAPVGGGVRDRYIGELSYKSSRITLAAEIAAARTRTGAASATNPTVPAQIMAVFGVLNIPNSPVSLIARVDHVDPNTNASNDAHTIVIGGVGYKPAKNVLLLADFNLTSYQGTPSASQDAMRNLGYIQAQFTF